jgi:hypothetical protein
MALGCLAWAGLCGLGSIATGRAEEVPTSQTVVAVSDRAEHAPDLLLAQGPRAGDAATGEGQDSAAGVEAAEQPPPSDFLAGLFGRTAASEPSSRLAGTPNMFGDLAGVRVSGTLGQNEASLPLASIGDRMKIAEDDNALPQDRVFFLYNHFNGALPVGTFSGGVPVVTHSFDLDRYTIGIEKTFLDRSWSVELRMPFTGAFDYSNADFSVSSGQVGNLTAVVKRLLYQSETTVAAIGLGIGTPTGSNADGTAASVQFTVHNQALHLMPFAGFIRTPNDRWFYQGFLQIDVPTNGNRIDYVDSSPPSSGTFGTLDDQTLLYADLCLGCWLSRNREARWLTGLAAVLELHYTTTLQDADVVSGYVIPQSFAFGNFANRQDLLDMTVGLHAEIADQTLFRVGCVLPLRSGDDRTFDAEVQVQVERRF